jgi:hypothetical protein
MMEESTFSVQCNNVVDRKKKKENEEEEIKALQ